MNACTFLCESVCCLSYCHSFFLFYFSSFYSCPWNRPFDAEFWSLRVFIFTMSEQASACVLRSQRQIQHVHEWMEQGEREAVLVLVYEYVSMLKQFENSLCNFYFIETKRLGLVPYKMQSQSQPQPQSLCLAYKFVSGHFYFTSFLCIFLVFIYFGWPKTNENVP